MRLTRICVHRNFARLALVVFTALASSISVATSSSGAQAATLFPACMTSQIVVSIGATLSNVSYEYPTPTGIVHAFSKKAVPVYFYNPGPVCHLLMGAPAISAVRDASNDSTVTVANMTIAHPPLPTTKRVVLQHRQRGDALFLFGSPVPKGATNCRLGTATGILVQGYANPVPSAGKFFPRRMRNVCFPVPGAVGVVATNTGVVWTTAPPPRSGNVRVLDVLLWVLLSLGVIGSSLAGARFLTRRAAALRARPGSVGVPPHVSDSGASITTGHRCSS